MPSITKKDLFDTLNEFYGKVIEPEFRAIRTKLDEHDQKFRDLFDHFGQIYRKFERLETEYYAIWVQGTGGIERAQVCCILILVCCDQTTRLAKQAK